MTNPWVCRRSTTPVDPFLSRRSGVLGHDGDHVAAHGTGAGEEVGVDARGAGARFHTGGAVRGRPEKVRLVRKQHCNPHRSSRQRNTSPGNFCCVIMGMLSSAAAQTTAGANKHPSNENLPSLLRK